MSSGALGLPYIPVGQIYTISTGKWVPTRLIALSLYICTDWIDKLAEDKEHEEEKSQGKKKNPHP